MKLKYTKKQLFIRLFEKVKHIPSVGMAMGISRDDYLIWIADDDVFTAKIAELIETFNIEKYSNQKEVV